MKRKGIFHKNSIMNKMLVPMCTLLLLQAVFLMGTMIYGRIVRQLEFNAMDILNERVINRKNYLQSDMVQRWSNVLQSAQAIDTAVQDTLSESGGTVESLAVNSAQTEDVIRAVAPEIIYLMRKNSVTGAFVIFAGNEEDDSLRKSGLYLRDSDPLSDPEGTSDLSILRAPATITKQLDISMETTWSPVFELDPQQPQSAFFFKPYAAKRDNPALSVTDAGYWSDPFRLDADTPAVITYSIPLVDAQGSVYGVLGVEINTNYMARLLPYDEVLSDKQGAYLLAIQHEANGPYETVTSSGPIFKHLLGDAQQVRVLPQALYSSTYEVEDGARVQDAVLASVQTLQLYNTNAPFAGDRWVLIGVTQSSTLFAFSQSIQTFMTLSLVAALLLGLVGVYIISRRFTKPIVALVREVKQSDPLRPVQFHNTNIREIDDLAGAISELSHNVADSASKLSQIVQMTSNPIGAFETRPHWDQYFVTAGFYSVLGLHEQRPDGYVPRQMFEAVLHKVADNCLEEMDPENQTYIFRIGEANGRARWVRLKVVREQMRALGVVEDVSVELTEKRKIEYERDYDVLTDLLNRRAFHRVLTERFAQPQKLKVAALLMMDLDNLKYINDNYGHDCGDAYIRFTAGLLQYAVPHDTVLARMSGDEFYALIDGYDSKEKIRAIIANLKAEIDRAEFRLPDGNVFRVRASAGIAWYPDDSTFYDQLIRYADFAMYSVKNTVKGEFSEFSLRNYEENAYLLYRKEDLHRLIDEKLVTYHFQPIVDARTGEVFAYEALMRSQMESLRTPMEILALARTQSMLGKIEQLTWFESLACFSRLCAPEAPYRLFINSISNQMLNEEDLQEIQRRYTAYLPHVVVEITENERQNSAYMRRKQKVAASWRASVALDDFGAGYNSEIMLLAIDPQYIKMDMNIVRHIDQDQGRQKLLQNLLSYAHERNIQVIAEGVESREEMETLIASGIDYVQGYYTGMPQPTLQRPSDKVRQQIIQAARNASASIGQAEG